MPHMDGWEMIQRLKADETTCRIPIIACSGETSQLGLGAHQRSASTGSPAGQMPQTPAAGTRGRTAISFSTPVTPGILRTASSAASR